MAIKLHIDLVFPKIATKKSMKVLSNKITDPKVIKKMNPRKVVELTEAGDLTMELIEGLTVMCHKSGCFHFHCEDFDEQKLNFISKAFATLSKIFDVGKEAKEVEFWLYAIEEKIPRSRIMKMIRKGIKTDFEAQVKDLYKEDVKVAGIRFVSAPNVSRIIDITGVTVRIGPLKMALDRFKDETTILQLIEKNVGRIKKILEV